jgi:hypothetical protein
VKFFQRWRVPVEPPVYTGPNDQEPEVEVETEVETETVEVSEDQAAEG